MAIKTMIAGEPDKMPSPCGSNCTYATTFDGPYFKCDTTSSNQTIPEAVESTRPGSLATYNDEIVIYNGTWTNPDNATLMQDSPDPTNGGGQNTFARFTAGTVQLLALSFW